MEHNGPQLMTLMDEIRSLRQEVATLNSGFATLVAYFKGRKTGLTVSTAEAATLLKTTPRLFRARYVNQGYIRPLRGHKCVFHRKDVERLRDQLSRKEL